MGEWKSSCRSYEQLDGSPAIASAVRLSPSRTGDLAEQVGPGP